MENTLYVALSRQMALRREMEIIANNMANMSTAAYKSERPLFQAFLEGRGADPAVDPADGGAVAFVQDYGTARDLAPGNLTPTGNPTDLAIKGDGFFAVQTADGERYTRDGHLMVDASGRLVTRDGSPVLGQAGQPVVLPRDGEAPVIAADGTISAGNVPLGRLRLVDFDNPRLLSKEGSGLLAAPADVRPRAGDVRVIQGMVEDSNVRPIIEMTRMIEVSRGYQTVQTLINAQQELQRAAIDKLGRIS